MATYFYYIYGFDNEKLKQRYIIIYMNNIKLKEGDVNDEEKVL